ncbi:GNAT family N-acetyltransferase [Paenibacillus thermotolerans]|uniref:GNAT family N-acetyltransferase n=1 Tax=Paenibacillus thermotolerans TaxID=3027807 RepID=UPI0023676C3E|nr:MULTISPECIES: GNAT family N-acetyltransferase [unclassified Paenibacillus]
MLVNLKHRTDEPLVQELVGYSVFPDPDKLAGVMEAYRADSALELYGIAGEDEEDIVGIIGIRINDGNRMTIEHIAVLPDCRGMDYGRGLILEAIDLKKPSEVTAETDEEAVNFYRSIGFTIESLGEKYPGVERFLCTFEAEVE